MSASATQGGHNEEGTRRLPGRDRLAFS